MAAHEVFSDAELDRLRGFPELTRLDLIRFFTLSPADAEFVSARRGDQNRLGLAVQLATLLWLGFVPDDVEAAPVEAVARLAGVLGVDPAVLSGYGRRGQTRTEHLRVAVAHLGWRTADRADWKGVDEFLSDRAMERDSPRLLFSAACDFLRAGRVVRPGVVTILKRVAAARDRAGDETWVRLSGLLTARWREVLDGLLVIDPGLGGSRLEWLQRGPVTASAGTIRSELAKLAFLRGIGADRLDLSMLAMERRRFLAGIARRSSSPALARRDPFRRYPILLASVAQSAIDVLDEVVGLFDQALSARESHAKARLTEHLADRARHGVDRDALLDEILEVVLDESFDDATVGTMLRRDIGMVRMQAAQDARPQPLPRDRGHLGLLAESFPYIRQFAPAVLTNVTFKASSNAGEVLAAVEILTGLYRSGIVAVPDDAPVGFIPTRWQGYLRAAKAARDTARYRRYWELCTLLALRDGLRCGDVFVPGSRRYADPTSFLITPQRWTPERAEYCDLIGRPVDPSAALAAIDVELHEALADLDQCLAAEPETGRVRVDDNGDLIVPALSAEAVPPEAGQLGHALEAILPNVQFASLLVEIDARTGLLDELVHAGGRTNRPPDLKRNLIYVLIAEATNIGLAAMARSSGVAYDTLVWTADWYLQPDTLERANHALVNYHHRLPGAALFGTGTMSSSDGQRFPVRGRSLNARHLSRYFANGQGISTYTHVTDQHSTFATRVIVATASESHYVLDDVLGNAADLPIIEHTPPTPTVPRSPTSPCLTSSGSACHHASVTSARSPCAAPQPVVRSSPPTARRSAPHPTSEHRAHRPSLGRPAPRRRVSETRAHQRCAGRRQALLLRPPTEQPRRRDEGIRHDPAHHPHRPLPHRRDDATPGAAPTQQRREPPRAPTNHRLRQRQRTQPPHPRAADRADVVPDDRHERRCHLDHRVLRPRPGHLPADRTRHRRRPPRPHLADPPHQHLVPRRPPHRHQRRTRPTHQRRLPTRPRPP